MSENLTPQQYEAVHNRGGRLLVSAAAGSGKTKVLVDRLMSYVMDETTPADLDDFLIITYTKAAAAELRGKITKKLSELIALAPHNRRLQQQIQRLHMTKISTIHSFCSDILREYAYQLDIPADFRVADELECDQLRQSAIECVLQKAYESADTNHVFRSFVDSQGFGRDDRQIPEIVIKVYSSAMCHLEPEKWLLDCVSAGDIQGFSGAEETVWGKYLIGDLQACLSMHIQALKQCVKQAEFADGFDKPVALLLNTISQLEQLKSCQRWDEIVKFGSIDFGRLTFSKKCSDLQLVDQIKAIRNACKKALEKKMIAFSDPSCQVLVDLQDAATATQGLVELTRAFIQEYKRRKLQRRVLDFADLEHCMLDLLLGKSRSGPTAAACQIAERFREIMVDEYQDSNGVQDTIFSVLTEKRKNCFMVGDVKQSIYQFRLADPSIFISKYESFEPAEIAIAGRGRKVLLNSNFRSSEGIISGVNHVFRQCMSKQVGGLEYGTDEMLNEGIPHCSIGEPEVELHCIQIENDTYGEESTFVAQRIRQLLDSGSKIREGEILRPVQPSDIVILLRSPGSVGREFQYALEQLGIPCETGSGGDLLQAQEIITLKSILQVIDNPLQDIPLIATLSSPVFAFTADELGQIRSGNKYGTFFDAVKTCRNEKCSAFCGIVNLLRMDARMDTLSELLQHIFSRTKLLQIYSAMPDGRQKSENLHIFCQLASDFESMGRADLSNFLAYLDNLEKRGSIQTGAGKPSNSVSIMSIHKSKGLEFPVVFLCGLSRRFNEESANSQVLCHKEFGLGLSCVDIKNRVRYPSIAKRAIRTRIIEEGLSEELRVLYVAMTRARDRLIMTYAAKDLEADLQDIAMRMEYSPNLLMTSQVTCPGEWVLQAAMTRIEAGELFSLGGNPHKAVGEGPRWKISVVSAPDPAVNGQCIETNEETLTQGQLTKLRSGLSYLYPYEAATSIPSKQTATQLKGRWKDQEIAEGTIFKGKQSFRKAAFAQDSPGGKDYGTALHLFMQHVQFSEFMDADFLEEEIQRLVHENLMTAEQARSLQREHIIRFFASEMGKRICLSNHVIREFKFSVLMDASKYYPQIQGEKVLLQGVVDCAVVEDDGIILIDFKTDSVTDANVERVADAYALQVSAYADALEEIFETSVKESYLYFFRLGKFVPVKR